MYKKEFQDSYTISDTVKKNPYHLVMDKSNQCSPYSYEFDPQQCFDSLNLVEKASIQAVIHSEKTKVLDLNPITLFKAFLTKDFSKIWLEVDLQEPFLK